MKTSWRAWRFFRVDWPLLLVAGGLLLASLCANLLKPWPLALIVDSVFGQKPLPQWLGRWDTGPDRALLVAILAAVVFGLHAGQGAITAAQNYLCIRIGLRGLERVRRAVFSQLQRLSLRFHQGAQSGDIIYRATWDTYAFQTLFQQGWVTLSTATLSLVLMVGVMWRLNRPLTGVAVAVVPLLLLVIRLFGRRMRVMGAAAQKADGQVAALVQQGIACLPLTQSEAREPVEEERFARRAAAAQTQRLAQHGWELFYWLAVAVVFSLGTAALLSFGARQVLANRLTVGELLIFLAYLSQLYDPLNQLSHVGTTLSHAGAGTQRVFEILDTPAEVKEAPDARPLARWQPAPAGAGATAPSGKDRALSVRGELVFENVSFTYQPGRPVLQGVSFRLAPGETAAVLGPSGAGKSSLLQLLPRFFDPVAGSVRLDGEDLRYLRLSDLRRHVGLLSQEPLLMPGTIAENIAGGHPTASPGQIEAAARAAHADGFIRALPQGYDTVVGEGAARLSVGEKQRLNLARVLLKDAPVLVLDEPTSALDAQTEALVVASLAQWMEGRTTLVVTHRLRILRHLGRILVLDQGRLVEDGRPEELLRHPASYYARLNP